MRNYKKGSNRQQSELFPRCLEDYISEENPVRLIDAYVDSLNLIQLGYKHTQSNRSNAGQPPFSPATLLKLYIYGFTNRINSSRRLEKESLRNIEVMWLLEELTPSYKTIANFRKDNSQALRETHKEFILLCKKLNLLSGDYVAVDGSFFEGNVSQNSFKSRESLDSALAEIEKKVAKWEEEFDKDIEATLSGDTGDLADQLKEVKQLLKHKEQLTAAMAEMEESGRKRVSITDPDGRMLNKRSKKSTDYNVQIATDSKHHLIVADDVTKDANDANQLFPISQQAKDVLDVEELDTLADAGYYNAAQLSQCLKERIIPYVPVQEQKSERFLPEDFDYDSEDDSYRCLQETG